jgi:hypothetical protein
MEIQETTSALGLPIVLSLNPFTKGWQGYVGIDKSHPLFGKNYSDRIKNVDMQEEKSNEEWIESRGVISLFAEALRPDDGTTSPGMQFSVHGGITYAGYSYWNRKETKVISTKNLTRYKRVLRLRHLTGNDLFAHYQRRGISTHKYLHLDDGEEWKLKAALQNPESVNEHPMFPAAWRVHEVYQWTTTQPKPKHVTAVKNGKNFWPDEITKTSNYVVDSVNDKVFAGDDRFWWFGWDCGHAGDEGADFTPERAKRECERLAEQLFFYKQLFDDGNSDRKNDKGL